MGFINESCKNSSLRTFSHLLALLVTLNCVLTATKESLAETVTEDEINEESIEVRNASAETTTADADFISGTARHELLSWHGTAGSDGGHAASIPTWSRDQGLPCFSLTRAHSLTRSCSGICNVIFENDVIATGGNYDSLALIKNEQEIISAYGTANGFDTSGNSLVIPLKAGDKISLALLEGELYESDVPYRAYTTFSGFLVPLSNHGYGDGGHRKPTPQPPYRPFEKPGSGIPFPGFIGGGGVFVETGPRNLPVAEDDVELLE